MCLLFRARIIVSGNTNWHLLSSFGQAPRTRHLSACHLEKFLIPNATVYKTANLGERARTVRARWHIRRWRRCRTSQLILISQSRRYVLTSLLSFSVSKLKYALGSYGPGWRAGEAEFPGCVTPLKGLLHCGDSTLPGLGLPAAAASGMSAARSALSIIPAGTPACLCRFWYFDELTSKICSLER